MMCMNLSVIVVLNINGVNYCCIINGISKSEALNLMQNTDLIKKAEHYKIQKLIITYKNP